MNVVEAKRRIIDHMIAHHMAEEPHCYYITEALHMAINALGAIDQITWERDVAIEQLNELGISFGQKINGVYLTQEEYDKLLEYKWKYEDLTT
jgi:hypothetical protein